MTVAGHHADLIVRRLSRVLGSADRGWESGTVGLPCLWADPFFDGASLRLMGAGRSSLGEIWSVKGRPRRLMGRCRRQVVAPTACIEFAALFPPFRALPCHWAPLVSTDLG